MANRKKVRHIFDTCSISMPTSEVQKFVNTDTPQDICVPDVVLEELLAWQTLRDQNEALPDGLPSLAQQVLSHFQPYVPTEECHYVISSSGDSIAYEPHALILSLSQLVPKKLVRRYFGDTLIELSDFAETEEVFRRIIAEKQDELDLKLSPKSIRFLLYNSHEVMLKHYFFRDKYIGAENDNDALVISAAYHLATPEQLVRLHSHDKEIFWIVRMMKQNDGLLEKAKYLEVLK